MGRGERRKPRFLSFPFPSSLARLFSLSPASLRHKAASAEKRVPLKRTMTMTMINDYWTLCHGKKIVWLLSACVKATSKIDHYRFSFCMYNGTDSVKQKRNSTTPINTLLFRLDIKFHSLWRRRTFSLLVMHSKRDNRGEELGRDIKHNLRTFRGSFLGRRH